MFITDPLNRNGNMINLNKVVSVKKIESSIEFYTNGGVEHWGYSSKNTRDEVYNCLKNVLCQSEINANLQYEFNYGGKNEA
jgi:hypothetical protein